jgi:hypothetical protein
MMFKFPRVVFLLSYSCTRKFSFYTFLFGYITTWVWRSNYIEQNISFSQINLWSKARRFSLVFGLILMYHISTATKFSLVFMHIHCNIVFKFWNIYLKATSSFGICFTEDELVNILTTYWCRLCNWFWWLQIMNKFHIYC